MLDKAEEEAHIQQICAFSAHRRAQHKQFGTLLSGNDVSQLKDQIQAQLIAHVVHLENGVNIVVATHRPQG